MLYPRMCRNGLIYSDPSQINKFASGCVFPDEVVKQINVRDTRYILRYIHFRKYRYYAAWRTYNKYLYARQGQTTLYKNDIIFIYDFS